jgi:endoglucanase
MTKVSNGGFGLTLLGLVALVSGGLGWDVAPAAESAPAAAATGPQPKVLHDFAKAPLFTFLGWDKKVASTEGGIRIQAPDCRGGAGYALQADLTPFAQRAFALTVTVGKANQAAGIFLVIKDADGTANDYWFKLAGLPAGQAATVIAEHGACPAVPRGVREPGKEPGFDLAKLDSVLLVGDFSALPVDVTVRALALVEPDAAILKARQALREQQAREEEARRQAELQKAARKRELLAAAPHPADGPDIIHVAPIAPDILALEVQEKQFAILPQIPYVPQEGDEIKRLGKEEDKLWVVEGGKVQESVLEVAVFRKQGGSSVKIGNLAVNANRLKPEDKATGQDLSVETVDEPAAYRIVGVDDPAWKDAAAPAAVWWKRKPNAYHALAFRGHVFLKLPHPLVEGKRYRVEFPGVNFRQASVEYLHAPAQTRSEAVHVTAIGFRGDDPYKFAFLSQWLGTGGACHYAKDLRFHVLDDATGKSVFDGAVQPMKAAEDKETFKAGRNYCKTDVLGMDFSAVATPGRYRVQVEGIGCSYPFPIAEDVWTKAFALSMKGLLHHRSGIELGPPFTDYKRPRNMHPADGAKVFASAGTAMEADGQDGVFRVLAAKRTNKLLPEAWGGHMDAGDWDRNAAHPAAMWLLVDLYEMFPRQIGQVKLALPPAEAGNAIPDILDEVLWNLDMYRRMQAADGGVGAGIESTAHPRPGEGSWQESLLLSAFAPDPLASFIYAASAAKLARNLAGVDKKLSETYAASARKAWDWARAHADEALASLDNKLRPGKADDLRQRRNLAAFELWRLTGEAAFHEDFLTTTLLREGGELMKQYKAVISYARLPDGAGDAKLRDAARKWIIMMADTALQFAEGNAFGVTTSIPQLPPIGFIGYLSTPEMIGAILPHAWLLTGEKKYLAGAVRACQFSAGANPDNQALTTGLGPDPVRYPLHIDSWVTGQPAPAGITVYAISDPAENYPFDAWAYTWFLQKMVPPSRTWPTHESYWDIYLIPSSNEFTIHQTIIPTAYYWGFLAAREAR